MENSSSSKTRSPARVLAAFLAVVMLFIVMPVLPVGAANTVDSITFKNATADSGYIFFDPDNNVNIINTVTDSPTLSWAAFGTVNVQRTGEDSSDVKVSTSGGFSLGAKSFAFGLFNEARAVNVAVYYSIGTNGSWIPLTPEDETEKYGRTQCPVYVIPQDRNMTGDIQIKVEESHTVTFSIDAGVKVEVGSVSGNEFKGSGQVVYSSKSMTVPTTGLTFQATLENEEENGYAPEVSVSSNSAKVTKESTVASGDVYKLTDVNGDVTVSVRLVKKSQNVNMTLTDVGKQYEIVEELGESNPVPYGGNFTFTVKTNLGYKDPTVYVKTVSGTDEGNDYDSSKIKTLKDGSTTTYTIRTIDKDLYVTVKGNGKQQHTVTFSAENGFDVKFKKNDERDYVDRLPTVEYGDTLKFQLERDEGWSGTPVVTANGRTVTGTSSDEGKTWEYSYDIKEDTDFIVTGLTRDVYQVSIIPQTDVFTLLSQTVDTYYNGSVTFTMTLAAGWELPKSGEITLSGAGYDGGKVKPVKVANTDSTYTITISGIKQSLTLTASDFVKKTLTVTVKYTGAGGDTANKNVGVECPESVKFGEGVNFTVTAKPGYVVASVTCTIDNNTTTLTPFGAAANQYSVTNVRDNVTIEVAVKVLTYTVTYRVSSSTVCEGMGKTNGDGKIEVVKEYTIGHGIEANKNSIGYTLTLETPTREGWNFEGWTNSRYKDPVKAITISVFANDMAEEFDAEWTVDTATNSQAAFFHVTFSVFNHQAGTTRFEATFNTNVNTSADKADAGAVKVLGHGFIYARSQSEYEDIVNSNNLSTVIGKLENAAQGLGNLGKGVAYYKHNDADSNVNAFAEGKFNLTMRNTDGEGRYGSAWVLVSIKGQTYLFISQPRTVSNNGAEE